jgi:IMP dehydrogenase/GMP reductase
MKLDQDIKLDFSDVLIRPKRSTLSSRSEVNLVRKLKFPNSGQIWSGIPIMVANMDTVGTLDMFNTLYKNRMMTCLHKYIKADEIIELFKSYEGLEMNELHPINYMILSTGITESNWELLNANITKLAKNGIDVKFICVDVANGYMNSFRDFCKRVRAGFPDKTIIAGNVVTREIVEELILNCGVDIVKCGIGSGCFAGDTRILMANGTYKNISDIEVGEFVINKDGNPVEVLNKMNKGFMKVIDMRTNNWHGRTVVTDNHKYFIGDNKWESIQNLSENSLRMPKNINFQLEKTDEIEGIKLNYKFGKSVALALLRNKIDDIKLLEEVYNSKFILPSKFYNLNTDYVCGIFDVLSKEINLNNNLNELLHWCSFVLGKNIFEVSIMDKKDVYDEVEVWDIEVNCDTHSFIANNSIVHNSVCTTRLQTGVGMPQFSAIMECADAAHGLNGHIISDGGVKVPGDFSKAFAGGADFVMSGSMFAGFDESAGDLITDANGRKFKTFYGMSSSTSMNKYHGGVAKHRSSEGKTVKVPYKGPVQEQVYNILGGIRSTCTYTGARRLKDLPKCATFMRVNNQVNNKYSHELFMV